jgi:hypothetical protein
VTILAITDRFPVPLESWEQAADHMVRARARGAAFDVRVQPREGSRAERPLTAAETERLVALATARLA